MDMKRLKIVLTLLLCLFTALPAHGEQVREPGSYQYSPYGDVVAAVPAYTLKQSYYAADLPGAQSLNNLRDAHVAGDRIYVLRDEVDHPYFASVLKSISAYTVPRAMVKLTGASGVTVDREVESMSPVPMRAKSCTTSNGKLAHHWTPGHQRF